MSEKTGLDHKIEALSARNIRYIVADNGYTDFTRIQTHAENFLLFLTPITGAKNNKKLAYLEAIETSSYLQAYQQKRKTAIEPIFSLLCELIGTDNNQKQLPVSSIKNVKTFLLLSIVLLQIAMLVNSIYNGPSREVSRMNTLFQ